KRSGPARRPVGRRGGRCPGVANRDHPSILAVVLVRPRAGARRRIAHPGLGRSPPRPSGAQFRATIHGPARRPGKRSGRVAGTRSFGSASSPARGGVGASGRGHAGRAGVRSAPRRAGQGPARATVDGVAFRRRLVPVLRSGPLSAPESGGRTGGSTCPRRTGGEAGEPPPRPTGMPRGGLPLFVPP